MTKIKTQFKFIPNTSLRWIFGLIFLLVLANLLAIYHFHFRLFERELEGSMRMFNLNAEGNLPTLFSYMLLFACSFLLFLIGKHYRNLNLPWRSWYGLGFIFLFLGVDEAIQIHELLIGIMRSITSGSGIFYYAWVIPYIVLVLIMVLVYIPFLTRLPRPIALLFVISGGIFVSGAVGVEMLGGLRMDTVGEDFVYSLLFTLEEFLEMAGIAMFVYTLLRLMAMEKIKLTLKLNSSVNQDKEEIVKQKIYPS